jgi:hypothetical protein
MGGKSSRTKGHGFEREVAILLREVFPNAKRKLEYQWQEASGVDLDHTGNLVVQCKRSKSSVPISKIEEIRLPGIKVLISKTDFKPIYATLELCDFIKLLKDVGEAFIPDSQVIKKKAQP